MEIAGQTLRLRYALASDVPALFRLGSDPEVTRYFSWGPYMSPEEPARYVDALEGERARGERLDFLIAGAAGEPLGVTGLTELNRRDRRAIVGTWLGREHWGTGANRESKALIAWLAFEVLGLDRLGAYASVENIRSQVALQRLGFVREGVLRAWHRHGDQVHDVVLLSWLREEWRGSDLARVSVSVTGEPPPAFRLVTRVSSGAAPS